MQLLEDNWRPQERKTERVRLPCSGLVEILGDLL